VAHLGEFVKDYVKVTRLKYDKNGTPGHNPTKY